MVGAKTRATLTPLIYDELRRVAAAKSAQEKTGHTLQATALVHEAYLRLAYQTIPNGITVISFLLVPLKR